MTHTVHTVAASAEWADLDLLAAARSRVKQLVGLLETVPFTEQTARIARDYLDEAGPAREAFDRFAQLDPAKQQRQLLLWQRASS
ncbi:hypothetical protein ACFWN5_37555 [Streptomyces sp. NPDC058430]|uniref:hypothetical protein n=1 Tax=Streptomyces sp. NPDC058430 TaxID=3346495 RepID=UPI0036506D5B